MAQDDNTSKTLRIKNWRRFQHYKLRRPPWIRLHRSLLDDKQWHDLEPKVAKLLINLWLIASESDEGYLPDINDLSWRLRLTHAQIIVMLATLSHWLEHDGSTTLADCLRDAHSEESKEKREKRKEERMPEEGNGASAPSLSDREKAFGNWNKIAEALDLSKAARLTEERRKKLDARLSEVGLTGWNQALKNLEQMPFCCGQNDRGWKVNFDWLLSPTNLTKIIELQYAREETPNATTRRPR